MTITLGKLFHIWTILTITRIFMVSLSVSVKYYKELASCGIVSPKYCFCHSSKCSSPSYNSKIMNIHRDPWMRYMQPFNSEKDSLTIINLKIITGDTWTSIPYNLPLFGNICFAFEVSDLASIGLEMMISSDFLVIVLNLEPCDST